MKISTNGINRSSESLKAVFEDDDSVWCSNGDVTEIYISFENVKKIEIEFQRGFQGKLIEVYFEKMIKMIRNDSNSNHNDYLRNEIDQLNSNVQKALNHLEIAKNQLSNSNKQILLFNDISSPCKETYSISKTESKLIIEIPPLKNFIRIVFKEFYDIHKRIYIYRIRAVE